MGWLQSSLHHSSISLSPLQLPVARHSMRPELGGPVVGGLFVVAFVVVVGVVCREMESFRSARFVIDLDVVVVLTSLSEWEEPDRITITVDQLNLPSPPTLTVSVAVLILDGLPLSSARNLSLYWLVVSLSSWACSDTRSR